MCPMKENETYPGQPKGLPDIIKLKINGIPTIINFKESRVVTPKSGGAEMARTVTNYLIAEGFLEAPEEPKDDLIY